ncbi:MAG: ADP-forming succinate--CoA ligase subunit beta [Chloroflexi bacterium]|nr:ADP-forming succinate--CoA ligase subunit beta [Chloroflexota bacterium]
MDLFEYQGKHYLTQFGIPIPRGVLATTVSEALENSAQLGFPLVVKAQVLVGGRGKAGGIRLCHDAAELTREAERILGMDIRGHTVERIWLEEAAEIEAEYYVSFTLDRGRKQHLGMLSREGGVEIETVAAEDPAAIARLRINPVKDFTREAIAEWVDGAGLAGSATEALITFLQNLYRCYLEGDATLVEINPLILDRAGKAIALDAKVTLDPAASFRHPEWGEFSENPIPDPRERLAKQFGLQYVGLSGNVGIIANGAGLAMSTVDIVDQVGGSAANFLDIGGGANARRMADALSVIHQDEKVRVIFINIFGGITRCDEIAKGILQAMREVELRCPLVVRLDGTNAVEGRSILASHRQEWLKSESDMLNAAKRAVKLANTS